MDSEHDPCPVMCVPGLPPSSRSFDVTMLPPLLRYRCPVWRSVGARRSVLPLWPHERWPSTGEDEDDNDDDDDDDAGDGDNDGDGVALRDRDDVRRLGRGYGCWQWQKLG